MASINKPRHVGALSGCIVAVLLLIPTLSGRARAEDFVKDQAGLFSAQAVTDANARISQIQQKSGKSVVIETVSSLPGGSSIDAEAHNRFQSERINGVLILICTNPHKIAVRVGRKTSEVFGSDQRAEVRKIFIDRFKSKDFDGGLTAAVDYAEGVFSGAVSATRQAPRHREPVPYRRGEPYARPMCGSGILGVVVLVLVGFFVISVLRGIFGAFAGGGPVVGGGGWGGTGWGGGFFSGLLGGALGSIIGNSLYGMFSGPREGYYRDEPSAYADDSGQQASDWMQNDNSAGGGDVGDSSDWGGGDVGDSSSLDSGGGDW